MKIGVCVMLGDMEGMPQKFKVLREQGFDNCQLLSWNPSHWTDENAEKLNSLLAEYGVEISAFWCGWEGPCTWNFYEGHQNLGLVPPEYREMRVKNLCDGADFAAKLGVVNVVTHMGFIPENPNDKEFVPFCEAVKRIADHLKKNGQWLLFETGQETPVTMLRCFETAGADNLGVNLDTANVILYGRGNPVDALDVFGKYVMDTHIKDGFFPTDGMYLGRECRAGDGKANIPTVVRKLLTEYNYEGPFTIEREISGDQQTADIIHAKKLIEDAMAEVN